MVDFTKLESKKKSYGGANGNKKSLIYNGELYMLKLPSYSNVNRELSYSNSPISEYLASKIFEMAGVAVQQVILGYYTHNSVRRIAVLCKDFEVDGYRFYDFASLRNQVVDSKSQGHSTELKDILEAFEEQDIVPLNAINSYFWEVFILDALLGNWDRHNGNWGYLYNMEKDDIKIAPTFDNGSSLFPQADEKIMKTILGNEREMKRRIFDVPLSAITLNGNKINYHDFVVSLANKDCNKALKRIVPKIDLSKIDKIIDEIEVLSDTQKLFYKTIISKRKTFILDAAYKELVKK